MTEEEARRCYPAPAEIDQWIGEIWQAAETLPMDVEVTKDSGIYSAGPWYMAADSRVIRFAPKGLPAFYGIWQPAASGPAPLVVHVPGYGAEISFHPTMNSQGFNLLTLSPLGYWTPSGFDQEKMVDGTWPVLPETIESKGQHGYKDWLTECVMAIRWAWGRPEVLPDRVSFYGTSQGGGTAMLLGSVFSGRGTRCVGSDVPFLTNFPKADFRGAYIFAKKAYDEAEDKAAAWHSMGLVDTLSHAYRMTFPVLLTEGGRDVICPPDTIEPLYELLPDVKAKVFLPQQEHAYTRPAMELFHAWFRLYA